MSHGDSSLRLGWSSPSVIAYQAKLSTVAGCTCASAGARARGLSMAVNRERRRW